MSPICYLTMARRMLIQAHNTWMNNNKYYDNDHQVRWWGVNFYPGSNMKYIEPPISKDNPSNMREAIFRSLSNNWPVILQYLVTKPFVGVHYVVAIGVTQAGAKQEYIIKDPLAGTNFINHSYSPIPVLAVDDPDILQAIFYQPADGIIGPQ